VVDYSGRTYFWLHNRQRRERKAVTEQLQFECWILTNRLR